MTTASRSSAGVTLSPLGPPAQPDVGTEGFLISYWLAPHTRVVLLIVFRKSRQVERAEVMRAIAAQQTCELGHEEHAPAAETFERKWQ
jgi:hypothetical protein